MISQVESTILSAYLLSDAFNRITTAHLKPDYFESVASKTLIEVSLDYTTKHSNQPTKVALMTIVEQTNGLREADFREIGETIEHIYSEQNQQEIKNTDLSWLTETTEKWCKERSVYNAILKSIEILDGKAKENNKILDKSSIPELMQKALSISFDTSIGHNYLKEFAERYAYMHSPISKIPFRIPILNKITGGGIEKKSLTIVACPPHSGKSLTMASWAADWMRDGRNVLVITLEMAEMKIGERIDANILNVDIGDLKMIPQKTYTKKFEEFAKEGYGELIVKEYPTSSAGATHFRFLLQELEIKQGFVPDVVVVDYMGICASSRYKSSDNMYQVQKSVGEELRALAQERDFAMVTAVQTNKDGFNGKDFGMESISESSGHAMTADFMLAVISTEDLIKLGQVRFKQLKNRWGSIHDIESFLLNMDRKKMKVYDTNTSGFDQTYYAPKNTQKVSDEDKDASSNDFQEQDDVFVFDRSMIRRKSISTELDV